MFERKIIFRTNSTFLQNNDVTMILQEQTEQENYYSNNFSYSVKFMYPVSSCLCLSLIESN